MAVQIQWRRDTAANWTAVNPTLAQGEAGLETDTGKVKMGDGATAWNALAYVSAWGGGGVALSAGTQSVSTGTVVFSNSNGISFGMSGSSRVTASYTVPSVAGLLSAINVSAGTTSNNLSALTFSDGGNVSFGLNGSVITASAPAGGGGGMAISAGTESVSTGTLVFSNSNGITFGMSGSSRITASHDGLTSQSNQAFSAGAASSAFQTLSFQDSNGISFSNNAGAIRLTHDLQHTSATSAITSNALHSSASRVINIVAATDSTGGGAASLSSNVSFSAANGLTFYTSAGNAVVGSYTVPSTAGLLSAVNLSAGTTSNNLSAFVFSNSNGVSFGLNGSTVTASIDGGAFNGGISTGGNTSGDTGMVSSRIVLAGGNNITLSGNTGALNRLTVTISAPDYAFSANNSSTYKTLVFQDSNGVSFSNNAGSLRITHALAGTSTGFAGANISGSMTHNSAGLNLSLSVAAPGAAAEQNAINLLGANTAGNTTATGSTIGLSGIGIRLSGTNDSQVVMSVRDATWYDWDNMKVIQSMNLISNITATAFSRGRPLLFPIEMDGHLIWNAAMIEMSRSTSGSNAFSVHFGLYTFSNSTRIDLLASMSAAFSATNTASVSGIRRFEISGIGTAGSSLTPGHYIGVLQFSAAADATASMNYSIRGGLSANPPAGLIRAGSDSNITATSALSTLPIRQFRGFWSTTSASPPTSMARSEVSMWTTGGQPFIWMGSVV